MTGFDWTPLAAIVVTGALIAALPLAWFWLRHRHAPIGARLRGLTLLTLFLTFDLVLLGAFTRLSDSGLGCPDWPGCYGHASPLGAGAEIAAAEAAVPTGPVTLEKAWIEMAHRYAATAIGAVILVLAVYGTVAARRGTVAVSPLWGWASLAWVVAQGLLGAFTVTLKLYPAIVTLHLIGGLVLLALLAAQAEAYRPRAVDVPAALRRGVVAVAALAAMQIALGGWVSTNYAVLACSDAPTCQGEWWPPMNWRDGFTVVRPLGTSGDGSGLPFPALTAIHMAHRIGALVVVPALLPLGWRVLARREPALRPCGWALFGVAGWQTASGLGNVLLEWPLAIAVAHTAGAAALVVVLTVLVARTRRTAASARRAVPDGLRAGRASAARPGRIGVAS